MLLVYADSESNRMYLIPCLASIPGYLLGQQFYHKIQTVKMEVDVKNK
jgi:hypothetical protein